MNLEQRRLIVPGLYMVRSVDLFAGKRGKRSKRGETAWQIADKCSKLADKCGKCQFFVYT